MNRSLLVILASIIFILLAAITLFIVSRLTPTNAPLQTTPTMATNPTRPEFDRTVNPDNSTRIYHTRLPDAPGDEWSDVTTSLTKLGERAYLGNFPPGTAVTLTIPAL